MLKIKPKFIQTKDSFKFLEGLFADVLFAVNAMSLQKVFTVTTVYYSMKLMLGSLTFLFNDCSDSFVHAVYDFVNFC